MRFVSGLAVVVVAFVAVAGFLGRTSPGPGVTPSRGVAALTAVARPAPTIPDCLSGPRDEGIRAIAWIAGNMGKSTIWPQIAQYMAEGTGDYYRFLVTLSWAGNSEAVAAHNVALYREERERGRADPINQREATERTRRVLQLVDELGSCLDRLKAAGG